MTFVLLVIQLRGMDPLSAQVTLSYKQYSSEQLTTHFPKNLTLFLSLLFTFLKKCTWPTRKSFLFCHIFLLKLNGLNNTHLSLCNPVLHKDKKWSSNNYWTERRNTYLTQSTHVKSLHKYSQNIHLHTATYHILRKQIYILHTLICSHANKYCIREHKGIPYENATDKRASHRLISGNIFNKWLPSAL